MYGWLAAVAGILMIIGGERASAAIPAAGGTRGAFEGLPPSAPMTNDLVMRFDSLQVGLQTYSNVVVTAKTSSDVFIRHRKGIANFKVSELNAEALEKLGYEVPKSMQKVEAKPIEMPVTVTRAITHARTNEFLAHWSRILLSRVTALTHKGGIAVARGAESSGATNELGAGVEGPVPDGGAPGEEATASSPAGNPDEVPTLAELERQVPRWVIVTASATLVSLPLIYFFFCYTGGMICRKAGSKPGFLIWVPILSLIPLTRAARLPAWMAALFIVPFLNLLFAVVWCVRLCNARGKGIIAALGLLCPITWPLAWLYLAYSK
ncbi:MAG TPA: hypothetical protein DCM86_18885 [Verrucomicrobiales bacterium]|nr:hypothetical protein [Verrucomicrobiales bacterium]